METKHTKGNWNASFNENGFAVITDDVTICINGENGLSENEANAKLIAAAPELLEALIKQYLTHLIFMPNSYRHTAAGQDILVICLNSICTATGKEHEETQSDFEHLAIEVKLGNISLEEAIKKITN